MDRRTELLKLIVPPMSNTAQFFGPYGPYGFIAGLRLIQDVVDTTGVFEGPSVYWYAAQTVPPPAGSPRWQMAGQGIGYDAWIGAAGGWSLWLCQKLPHEWAVIEIAWKNLTGIARLVMVEIIYFV